MISTMASLPTSSHRAREGTWPHPDCSLPWPRQVVHRAITALLTWAGGAQRRAAAPAIQGGQRRVQPPLRFLASPPTSRTAVRLRRHGMASTRGTHLLDQREDQAPSMRCIRARATQAHQPALPLVSVRTTGRATEGRRSHCAWLLKHRESPCLDRVIQTAGDHVALEPEMPREGAQRPIVHHAPNRHAWHERGESSTDLGRLYLTGQPKPSVAASPLPHTQSSEAA